MVDVGLGDVFGVPGQQVVEFRVDVFGRAILVDDAVGPGRIVGHGLEGAGVQRGVEPLSELVHGPVGGLVGDDNLVELPDGGAVDGVAAAYFDVDGAEGTHVVLRDGRQVVGVLAGAGEWNCGGYEALFDEGSGLGVVQPVGAFNDAGLDGPAAVQRRQAGVLDVRPLAEPLLAQVVIRREVAVRLRHQRRDGSPLSRSHGVMLLDAAKVGDIQNGQRV